MDYWKDLSVQVYDSYEDFRRANPNAKIFYSTTKAKHLYTEVSYPEDCFLMFGKESAGIPEEILKEHKDTCVRIPMLGETRSLNLSNAAAIVIYEALRQHGFAGLTTEGELHIHPWSYYE